MGITATISAGVDTGIGSHGDDEETSSGDNQFEIADGRSVDEIYGLLRSTACNRL